MRKATDLIDEYEDLMIGPISANCRKLTGVWQGVYTYPHKHLTVPFVATLIEAGQLISGSTHESCLLYGNPNEILFATLQGNRDANAVIFVKTYEGTNPNYRTVNYVGSLNAAVTEIEGRWIVPGSWSGKFLMLRSGDIPEAVSKREGAKSPIPEFT